LDAEWVLAAKHALSYASPYVIGDSCDATVTEGEVRHGPLSMSSEPRFVGSTLVRNYIVHKTQVGIYLRIWANFGGVLGEV
jgi:hypothetical protein